MRVEDKFLAMVHKVVQGSNMLLYVGDARYPSISVNRVLFNEMRANRPVLVVLNKSDLVPRSVSLGWENHFRKTFKVPCIAVSAKDRKNTSGMRKVFSKMASNAKIHNVDLGVVGLPNTGKSSLINIFKGSYSCSTSPVPGHTRALQKLRASKRVMIWDTPGVTELGEQLLSEADSMVMASVPAEDLEDPVGSGELLARRLYEINSKAFLKCVPPEAGEWEGPEKLLEYYGNTHGITLRGGQRDMDSGAKKFIHNYMAGRFPVWEEPPPPPP